MERTILSKSRTFKCRGERPRLIGIDHCVADESQVLNLLLPLSLFTDSCRGVPWGCVGFQVFLQLINRKDCTTLGSAFISMDSESARQLYEVKVAKELSHIAQ